MPALTNQRHEMFAQAYAKGEHAGNASACYKTVYGKDDRFAASRIQQRLDVSQRVVELRAEITTMEQQALQQATEKLGISKEWVLEELVENVNRPGKRKYDPHVAIKSLELIGKHLSMFASGDGPTVNVNVGLQFVDRPPPESHEQWEARRRAELAPKPKLVNGNGKAHS